MAGHKIIFFPDYRRSNPYQTLLYKALPKGWGARFGALCDAIRRQQTGKPTVFHLHWTAPLFCDLVSEAEYEARADEVLADMAHFQSIGGRILWTVHNILPHHRRYKAFEIRFRTRLAEQVDRVHVHEAASIEQIEAVFPLPADKIVLAPHGHLVGAYPRPFFKRIKRPHLGLANADLVAGVIGQLRPNKGIEDLIEAAPHVPDVQTFVAGRVTKPAKPGDFADHCEKHGVICREGFIPRRHIAAYADLMDVMVLPYREILTSGSLMFALSHAKPVIAPDLPTFEAYQGRDFVWTYTPGDPASLARALSDVAACGKRQLAKLGRKAEAHIREKDWQISMGQLLSAVS